MSCRLAACVACLLLTIGVAAMPGQEQPAMTPERWYALQMQAADKADRIMRQADRQKTLLGRYETMLSAMFEGDRNPAFPVIFSQYLAWYQTYIGDYPNAAASFSAQGVQQPDDHAPPLASGMHAQPAVDAIARLARGRQAVFFNEAHHLPLTRTLTIELLARLREEGFDTFAAETLYARDDALQARGYPIEGSGFYTNEPLCAEMVRTALRLGYRVVPYESDSGDGGDARERSQARNLYERVFKTQPKARLVVDAGYGHIRESGKYLGGQSMAEHLRKLVDIDPLTVEQTMLVPHADATHDHPYYTDLVARLKPTRPLVFIGGDGKPWALREGYDVSVLFPPQVLRRGRPTWLALDGLRRPYRVDGEDLCRADYPCLVEARYADEPDAAIAADRLVFDPPPASGPAGRGLRPTGGASVSELYLRAGRYRLVATDARGRVLGRRSARVPGG
ncbi:hypothetical protein J7I44_12855 [Frateuria sp. MAH-13]|uniref:Uncharacterized protein n=1 Tax=Frateuria flava TaxID=2821489 RepID=A0ABS4DQ65_9GAMM|nr:hypothetical protein [Frateuria flava]MBP1475196.1 hypothetical protein [Frateuria flava]